MLSRDAFVAGFGGISLENKDRIIVGVDYGTTFTGREITLRSKVGNVN